MHVNIVKTNIYVLQYQRSGVSQIEKAHTGFYPQYANAFNILKNRITALNDSMAAMLKRMALKSADA